MPYLFTSESVSEGHPDKIADQISDTLLDNFLAWDEFSKVTCQTLVTTGLVVIAGEVQSISNVDVQNITRDVIRKIGYTESEYMFEAESCEIISTIQEQTLDIGRCMGPEDKQEQGAGDQGTMFGYASNETDNYMPLTLDIAHKLLIELAVLRRENKDIPYLRPDAKSQVTIEYSDDHKPIRIDSIVISAQHDEFDSEENMQQRIFEDIISILIPRIKSQLKPELQALFTNYIKYYINPTGRFVIGGPHGNSGLTGHKIIVDTYGGKGAHGGGTFSGKDPSNLDRSAAYATRHIAKNLVAAGVCDEVSVQVSYAIGSKNPIGIYINTDHSAKVELSDKEISQKIESIFDMTPYGLETRLKLRSPIYAETAAYGHMGRKHEVVTKKFENASGTIKSVEVELFTWEKLDYVDKLKIAFGL